MIMEWSFRKAVENDSEFVLSLRNNPEVYKRSLNAEPIPVEVHEGWFTKSISNPKILFLIGELAGKKSGVVRFNLSEDFKNAVISIQLDPALHGQGFGKKLLKASESELLKLYPSVVVIEAEVKCDNEASLKMFNSLEYSKKTFILQKNIIKTGAI